MTSFALHHDENSQRPASFDDDALVRRASLTASIIPRRNGTPKFAPIQAQEKCSENRAELGIERAAPVRTIPKIVSTVSAPEKAEALVEKSSRISKTVRVSPEVQQKLLALGQKKNVTQQALLLGLINSVIASEQAV